MSNKSLARKVLEMLEDTSLTKDVSEDIKDYCPKTDSIQKRIFTALGVTNVEQYTTNSYYGEYNTVKIRISNHEPKQKDIETKDNNFVKIFEVVVKGITQAFLVKYLTDMNDLLAVGSKKIFGCHAIPGKIQDTTIDAIIRKINNLNNLKIDLNTPRVIGDSLITHRTVLNRLNENHFPKLGFILPDGSYLDSKDYNVITHEEMASIILKKKKRNESKHEDLITLMQRGYIRFKDENKFAVILTETYPTYSQFSRIKEVIDIFSNGLVEITAKGMPRGYIEMTRDTLDADMRKLEALLNKVKPPQPKIS